MNRKGIPFILAAPSGAGKTSLVNALLKEMSDISVSISHTTRPIRPAEKEGVNYYFVSQEKFEALIAQKAFMEYAKVFDHYYGTSRAELVHKLDRGIDVLLDIDWQGAAAIRKQLPEAVSIFILPPELDVLMKRLQDRKQDTVSVIENRMQKARNEISHYQEFDYLVVNDDFAMAVADLKAIIRATHLQREHQEQELSKLLRDLLA